jgi:hypothetical protein
MTWKLKWITLEDLVSTCYLNMELKSYDPQSEDKFKIVTALKDKI